MTKFRKPRAMNRHRRSDAGKPRTFAPEGMARLKGPKTQAQLKALRRTGVPLTRLLNPHGRAGVEDTEGQEHLVKPAWKPQVIRRKRERLKLERERALEMHELQEQARQNAQAMLRTLVDISKNKRSPEAARIAASVAVLDRGYGKASQTSITANVTNGKAADLTGDELDKRVKQALKRVEDITRRAPEAPKSEKRPADLRKLN